MTEGKRISVIGAAFLGTLTRFGAYQAKGSGQPLSPEICGRRSPTGSTR
jgi:hypothetical protein